MRRSAAATALLVGTALHLLFACGAAKQDPASPPPTAAAPEAARQDAGVATPIDFGQGEEEDAGPSIDCAGTSCAPRFVPFQSAPLAACCPKDAPNHCGVDLAPIGPHVGLELGCAELAQPGQPDRACPARGIGPIPAGTLLACRKPDGACGLEVTMPNVIDFGCVDVSKIPLRPDAG